MLILFSLIVMRMTGAVALNPIFGRSNLPASARAALIMVLSVLLYISFGGQMAQEPQTMLEYGVMLIKELLVGFTLGFAVELAALVVRFASSIMDFAMGLTMAQIYDPQYHSQVTVTSGLYYAFFVLLFFATNGHMRVIGIFYRSATVLPFGAVTLNPELPQAILSIFRESITMGLQYAFPLVAMELVTETAVGILMRMIPQINVFAVNFQIKIIVGLFMLVLMFNPMADRLYQILDNMYLTMEQLLVMMR